MSGDIKEFYRRKLHEDISLLGVASKTLRELASRWDEKAEEIEGILKAFSEYQALLTVEGHMGYHPKEKEYPAKQEEPKEALKEAAELAKEVEAKRLAAEKAKAEKEALKAEKAAKKAELESKLAELEE